MPARTLNDFFTGFFYAGIRAMEGGHGHDQKRIEHHLPFKAFQNVQSHMVRLRKGSRHPGSAAQRQKTAVHGVLQQDRNNKEE